MAQNSDPVSVYKDDSDPLIVVSSDGHAGALMADYRPYLDEAFREEFDSFLLEWNECGSRAFDVGNLKFRLDPEFVDEWTSKMIDTGRVDGYIDPVRRLEEVEKEGIAAEVLFPDFGIPFELYPPVMASALGIRAMDEEHKRAAYSAFNRWLADYVSVAPGRFAGMAFVSWNDVELATRSIRDAHASGLKGVVLPKFSPARPLFHEDFTPIWNTLGELGMVVNSHGGMSATTEGENTVAYAKSAPHPAVLFRLHFPEHVFYAHNVLSHLIWGGVLERHPDISMVFTEQQAAWVAGDLLEMDYSYEGSYLRNDYKEVMPSKPSEYFRRQCYIGASIFSQEEVDGRHVIGLDQMMLGMDFPHHEGTIIETTQEYLRATLGVSQVPVDEARKLVGETAAKVFNFDMASLRPVAERIGPKPEYVLSAPEEDLFPRGDVHKPVMLDRRLTVGTR